MCCFGAFVFERSGTAWVRTELPKGTSAWANATAIGSDPTTGAAVLVAGVFWDDFNNAIKRSPVLWYPGGGGWTAVTLPEASDDDVVDDATASGLAVGMANGRAAAWEPNGVGSWALSFLGTAGSRAFGVNSPGTIIVGEVTTSGKTTGARYWLRSGSSWTGPTALPGGCTSAKAVDDYGRILANGCPNGSRGSGVDPPSLLNVERDISRRSWRSQEPDRCRRHLAFGDLDRGLGTVQGRRYRREMGASILSRVSSGLGPRASLP